MTIQTFSISELPPTLNELNNMHYMVRAKTKEKWNYLVELSCLNNRIKPVDRVAITLEIWFPDKRRRDLDNYGGLGFKFIQDGLVKAGILTDDSVHEIPELRLRYGGIIKPPFIQIYLEEC